MTSGFASECYDLAARILSNEGDLSTTPNVRDLAIELHATAESFIEDKRRAATEQGRLTAAVEKCKGVSHELNDSISDEGLA